MLKNTSKPRKRKAELMAEGRILEEEKSHGNQLKSVESLHKIKRVKMDTGLESVERNIELVKGFKENMMIDKQENTMTRKK